MTKEKPVTQSQFARDMGVTHTTVQRAIATGKIRDGLITKFNKKRTRKVQYVIPSIAKAEWGKHFDPHIDRPSNKKLQDNLGGGESVRATTDNLAGVKLLQAQVRLKKETIELAKQQGKLLEKDKVYLALFELAKTVRKNLEVLPDRLIHQIMAAPSSNDGHNILTKGINEALSALADPESIRFDIEK